MKSPCCNADVQYKFNNGRGADICTKCRQIIKAQSQSVLEARLGVGLFEQN